MLKQALQFYSRTDDFCLVGSDYIHCSVATL